MLFIWVYKVRKLNDEERRKRGTNFWGEFRETKEVKQGSRKENQARAKAEATKRHG